MRCYHRTRGWWEALHFSHSFNCTFPLTTRQQWGGTALFSINKAAHQVADCRIDESKIRRWSWMKYRGRNDYKLRIFVTYSLKPPSEPLSVYAQHRRFLATKQDRRCPRLVFIQDLSLAIELASKDGEQVIVMLDGNHNMKDSPLESQLKSLDLKEALIQRHGPNGPSTFRRNTS